MRPGGFTAAPLRLLFILCVLSVVLCVLCGEKAVGSSGRVYAVVLGVAQDGGVGLVDERFLRENGPWGQLVSLGQAGSRARVLLVHLNHANRLWWDEPSRRRLLARGVGIARAGQELPL